MTHAIRAICPALLVAAVLVLTGCGSAPPRSAATGGPGGPPVQPRSGPAGSERDGPDATPPSDLASVPDAEPKIEPIRPGGPNKPYEVQGRDYKPITEDRPFSERGLASWYGKKFHGRRTASGEIYNMYAMTAAHPTLPIPSYVRVRNPANDREVVVRINDRGPFHSGRIIDLSYTAAYKLGVLRGVTPVELSRITFEEIRAGAWRKEPGASTDAVAAAPPRDNVVVRRTAAAAEQEPTSAAVPVVATPAPVVATVASPASPLGLQPPPASDADARPDPIMAASVRPSPGFWVQLGAFRQREGADGFHRRVVADLDWLAPLLAVFSEADAYRLQAGPYASRDQAQDVARRVREALSLVPVIVERR